MKTILNYTLVLFAGLSIALSCSKINEVNVVEPDKEGTEVPVGKQITINATLSDALTRVEYSYDESGPKLSLKWESTDILVVSNSSNSVELTDPTIDETGKTAIFTGTLPEGGEPYTVSVKHAGTNLGATQTQVADGDLTHLEYAAMATGVTEADFEDLNLTQTTGVLGLISKIPTVVSASVKAVIFQTENALFNGSNTLTVNLGTPGAGTDNILYVYANVAAQTIPAGTKMFIRFKVSDGDYDYYTRYQVFASEVSLTNDALNGLKLNCSHIDRYAGKDDKGTEAAPYLIADMYQLKAVQDLASTTAKTYFKMIDDVDMSGMTGKTDATTYIPVNKDVPDYTKVVDFDGNNKTISNLGKSLFYVLKGLVRDLTLSDCQVTSRGILAEFIQGTGHTITNVNVINGTVNSGSDNVGGLIGCINNGSGTCATISDCTVSNTSVTGKGVVGGIIGYANDLVIISGCKYNGGTVKASARWAGGAIGSIGEFAAFVSDCNVNNAVVESSSDRVGGFVGQIAHEATVKGCTVGTSDQRVTVNSTMGEATANVGGFVGVCYGNVIANNDARNKAYVTITSNNTNAATKVNIGGFAGYVETATIENCDVDADLSSVKGQQVGGFAAILTNLSPGNSIDHCTAKVAVTGANYTGGFIGLAGAADQRITNNSSSGTVSGAATVGGFAGQASQGSWTNNTTSCTVTGSGANIGGFAGQINGNVNVSKCSSTGESVSASGNVCGGFAAIAANGASISDCYSTTNLLGATRKRGGLIGHVSAGTVSIERCYASGDINANFELGGLVGFVSVATFTMSKSAAWNASITASYRLSSNWSSASIVGVAEPTCTLTDNYRNPNMVLTTYWGTIDYGVELTTDFQQPNVSSSTPLTDWDGNAVTSSTMRPYNGKCETGKTLSQLASSTLGWSSSVWDFSGELPVLK